MADKLSRRDFMKVAAAGLAGVAMGGLGEKIASSEHELRFPLIIGVAFMDANRNGMWSQENSPINGIPVSLVRIERTNGPGKTVAKTITDESGIWSFQKVDPGLYRVSVDIQESSQGQPREIGINKETKVVFGGIHGIRPEDLPAPTPKQPQLEPQQPITPPGQNT